MPEYNRIEHEVVETEEAIIDSETGEEKVIITRTIKENIIPLTSDEITALLAEKQIAIAAANVEEAKLIEVDALQVEAAESVITDTDLNNIKEFSDLVSAFRTLLPRIQLIEAKLGITHKSKGDEQAEQIKL